ncbi:MAG: hypothetical protein L0Z50_35800 [Verrucomicrobiales bacterium]|nr:hypothetical protein [Verrucomicrobiales bacterium]
MEKNVFVKLGAAGVMLLLAGLLLWRFMRDESGVSEKAFFYDVSKLELFVGPRTAVPPIKGIDGPDHDGVRAVVISTNGVPEDKSSWTIAYLEMYSPELKRQMEDAQKTGTSPQMGRAFAQSHRFVRRLTDSEWSSMSSPEGERIVTEWAQPGKNGILPVVCAP